MGGVTFRRIPDEVRDEYYRLRAQGLTRGRAGRLLGVSLKTAQRWDQQMLQEMGDSESRLLRFDYSAHDPLPLPAVLPEGQRALDDFGFFRARYLGRRSTPWQEEAAHRMIELARSPATEFVVVNVPPGSGKSTLFVHDIPLWMICRDRSIRVLLGSATQRLATTYSKRLRETLARTRPLGANPGQGRMVPAAAAPAQDFGRFKPKSGEGVWRAESWTVEQWGGEPADDKEPTCQAFGADTEFLGSRANVVIWDDLVTSRMLRNAELVAEREKWWAEEGETRVEPGGLLILQGQRMGPNDLYRHCLKLELAEDDVAVLGRRHKYHHIVYPAHFEDRCEGLHGRDAPSYPRGCLLDPVRLPWSGPAGLAAISLNREQKFRVQYQQEDVDPTAVLVPMVWVTGGRDEHGEYQGCWDKERGVAEIPVGLVPPVLSIASADPSPTKFWSIQWWLVHPPSQQRFLLDLLRQSMDAPDFLDWNANMGVFHGVMDEWQQRSRDVGVPITHWIVEANAAQRFILQYDHFRRWQRLHGVQVIPHQTHRNKADESYGVEMLKFLYRDGRVRLPGRGDAAREVSLRLVDEVTRWPECSTDDCVMAQWFVEFNLERLASRRAEPVRLPRPSWMGSRRTLGVGRLVGAQR